MGGVTPDTCRVVLQWINICILLHLLDFYSHWIMMHGTMSLKFTSSFHSNYGIFGPVESTTLFIISGLPASSISACTFKQLRRFKFYRVLIYAFRWVVLDNSISSSFSFKNSQSWTAWLWKWSCNSRRNTRSTRQRNIQEVCTPQQNIYNAFRISGIKF